MGNRCDDVRTLALVGGAGLIGVMGTVLGLAVTRGPGAGSGMSAGPPQDAVPEAAPLYLYLPEQPGTGTARIRSERIRIRSGSLGAPDQVVVYIDGVRADGGDVLSLVRPDRIDRIEVIKGSAAKRAYGSEAEGGVVQIFTKPGDESDTQGSGSGR